MFRKIGGVVCLLLALLLSLALLKQLPVVIHHILKALSAFGEARQMGYAAGQIIGFFLFLIPTIFLWKYGIRLLKAPVSR
ncbi:MAG: hypothetical protein U0T73_05350 [Chitinophagales bacterium]